MTLQFYSVSSVPALFDRKLDEPGQAGVRVLLERSAKGVGQHYLLANETLLAQRRCVDAKPVVSLGVASTLDIGNEGCAKITEH